VISALALGMLVLSAGSALPDALDRPFHNWQARKFHDIERQRTDFTCGAASLAIISQQYWGKPIKEPQFTDAIRKSGWIDTKALRQQAQSIVERFNVKAGGPDAAAQSLSGGNLQKFIVAREIDANPRLFIVSQPTTRPANFI